MSRPFGVYVHFPWCTHRCPYCDFAVTTEAPARPGRYAAAVREELASRAASFSGSTLRSVYVGGGTPSLWDPAEVAEVLAAIRQRFGAAEEITLEVNPESSTPEKLAAWRAAGVNRVSVGVQSFDPGVLAKLGRRHAPDRAAAAIREAAEVLGNVSVDLIYGARRSTVETARRDAERAVAAGAAHVSAYALTLDADVLAEEVPLARLARQGRLPLPSEEETLAQARAIRATLRRLGLERYEISNYARPGHASVHNRLYWSGDAYLGLGAGAYGCFRTEAGAVRYGNLRDAAAYLAAVESGRSPVAEEDVIDRRADRNERLMLALRTRDGFPVDALSPAQRAAATELRRARLAVARRGALVLTTRGMELHSAVVERLME